MFTIRVRRRDRRLLTATALLAAAACVLPSSSPAATSTVSTRVTMSDGVTLDATVSGQAPLTARPLIVEFSPYGADSGTTTDGPAYNYLLVQIRGTGDSNGEFDALGPRTQQDVRQTLTWACHQPWSDGRIGLNGFSASAITVYNSLHLELPCVRTAVLRSGTFELYRDLLWPGGVSNAIPGLAVLGLIGAPAAAEGFNRAPLDDLNTTVGLFNAGLQGGLDHPTLDAFWQARRFQGNANHWPLLLLDSFFDVEPRGAFQGFQALKGLGSHLLVVGGHDGAPTGTDDGVGEIKAWFDHALLARANGVTHEPRVQMLIPDGSREGYLNGTFLRLRTTGWPVPGTRWRSLWLSAARAGSAGSVNDGSLASAAPPTSTTESYAAIPSNPLTSDPANVSAIGQGGLDQAATRFPLLTETSLGEPEALTYTSPVLGRNLLSVGPAALRLRLSSTAPETAIWAVISDVWPDGSSHPVATGRLSSAYPDVVREKSLRDPQGDIVEPYGDFSVKRDAPPGAERAYEIEFWPIGNKFRRGHRIRLVITGASAASLPAAPALNTVSLGGTDATRLLLPEVPLPSSGRVPVPGCPVARGRLSAAAIGPLHLGMSRAQARRALSYSTTRGRRATVVYCLAGHGIRAGYATAALLAVLPPHRRARLRDRAVLLLTSNRRYALEGVRPGDRLAARRPRHGAGFGVGRNVWYLGGGAGGARGVMKVRRGVIEEIGVADQELTATRRRAAVFFRGFG